MGSQIRHQNAHDRWRRHVSVRIGAERYTIPTGRSVLTAQLDAKASPAQLAAAATALGMVPTNGTGWLRLSDGSVQGVPEPAGAGG